MTEPVNQIKTQNILPIPPTENTSQWQGRMIEIKKAEEICQQEIEYEQAFFEETRQMALRHNDLVGRLMSEAMIKMMPSSVYMKLEGYEFESYLEGEKTFSSALSEVNSHCRKIIERALFMRDKNIKQAQDKLEAIKKQLS